MGFLTGMFSAVIKTVTVENVSDAVDDLGDGELL